MDINPGAVIRELRKDRGWTCTELARRSKLSDAQISKLELGQESLKTPTIFKIAKALGIKPCMFFMSPHDREVFENLADVRWNG
jgi:transcriptional regulator with XRE-family HTH domain